MDGLNRGEDGIAQTQGCLRKTFVEATYLNFFLSKRNAKSILDLIGRWDQLCTNRFPLYNVQCTECVCVSGLSAAHCEVDTLNLSSA